MSSLPPVLCLWSTPPSLWLRGSGIPELPIKQTDKSWQPWVLTVEKHTHVQRNSFQNLVSCLAKTSFAVSIYREEKIAYKQEKKNKASEV